MYIFAFYSIFSRYHLIPYTPLPTAITTLLSVAMSPFSFLLSAEEGKVRGGENQTQTGQIQNTWKILDPNTALSVSTINVNSG